MQADVQEILALLPPSLQAVAPSLSDEVWQSVQEIRIREGMPMILSLPCGDRSIGHPVSTQEVNDSFLRLCGYAVHTHQEELRQGFITAAGGWRVGVAGTAVVSNGTVVSYRQITSLCIRVPRTINGCADALIPYVNTTDGVSGLLLCGTPASGKTTLLRDLARSLSRKRRVAVVDERRELVFGDVSGCDVLVGCPKAIGIVQAVRTLAPDAVIADEVGTEEEWEAVSYAAFCGVPVIASVHAYGVRDLTARKQVRAVLAEGGFPHVAFLPSRDKRHEGITVRKAGEWIENLGSDLAGAGVCGYRMVSRAVSERQ